MQVSVQTQRKKKNNSFQADPTFNQIPETNQPQIDSLNNSDKKQKIKKLTLINRQLIDTLKKQNDELTKRINKQRGKSQSRPSSLSNSFQQPKQIEGTKKQLSNAYKQIEMYKSVLQNLKAKQISTDSLDKIKMLQNKMKMQDQAIEELQKEVKFLKNIKEQQQKQLQVIENEQIKKNVQQLQNEIKNLKQKLKTSKKQGAKRQQLQKKQHAYYMELQMLLRKQNDEYYPGKEIKSKDTISNNNNLGGTIPQTQITEKMWQSANNQLAELKKQHQETNKKIELLTRQRNKEQKSYQQNQLKLKQKLKKLHQVKNKFAELTKLVTIKQKKEELIQQESQNQDEGYDALLKNGKKDYKPKNSNKERQVKKWVIPQGYTLQKGKIMPESIFFSDKTILKNTKKSKIIEIHVWTDSENIPCILQFYYSCEKNKRYEGIQSYPYSISHLEENIINLKQGDYLYKMEGKMDKGYLVSLTFVSKFGQKTSFNNQSSSSGESFKFEPRPNQLPSCLFGAIVKNQDDQVRICHIGCEFIQNW